MPDTTWKEIVPESIIFCKICGKKIWKYWHIGNKKVYPEMSLCAPCQFNIYRNPLKVRKLSELEMAECKILLEQLNKESNISPRSQKGL